ncbi:LLM class flavin-dependent oxidoreductase [Yinghuangia seranimata]|uniref:LLM class flavin-dependent oxidoreductase n=1 Tax=Yinghuangia seranimata TaxID=408067 RepID=UPI00248BBAE0|nr:LLM class flavin-dependent oxidoreductase [Yinghuangia seranimata]MDI2132056.1 LLM class flavin-dependent oxidoreductase [Yinghuangia seranimata]
MTSPQLGMFLPMPVPGASGGSVREIADAARRIERVGLESAWQGDLLLGRYPTLAAGSVLAAAAAVTERIGLGYAVKVPALHPLPWLAQDLATTQYLSGGRVLYGVTPGDGPFERWRGGLRDQAAWHAVGADYADRERATDAFLERFADLVAGKPVPVDPPGTGEFALTFPVPAPPLLIGGDDAAVFERVVRYGDAWFPAVTAPSRIEAGVTRLRELADAAGRPAPGVTVALPVHLGEGTGGADERARASATIAELYGVPADEASDVMVFGPPRVAAELLAHYAEIGVDRVVFSVSNDRWDDQLELIAEAGRLAAGA